MGVAEREPAARDATAPHITLRQAVRPVIVAHGILSSEQLGAGTLADEAKNLVRLTEELLRKLGRVHLLTGSATATVHLQTTDMTDLLVEAYANAGISWARVLASVIRLAELLVDEHDWTTVALLARVIAEAGEAAVAEHIERGRFRAQAAIHTHPDMTSDEIRHAVARLSTLPELPERVSTIRSRRLHLTGSAHSIAQRRGIQEAITIASFYWNIAQYLSQNPAQESGYPDYTLPERLFPQILATLDMCEV